MTKVTRVTNLFLSLLLIGFRFVTALSQSGRICHTHTAIPPAVLFLTAVKAYEAGDNWGAVSRLLDVY